MTPLYSFLLVPLSVVPSDQFTEKSVQGMYRMSTGFQVYALSLKKDFTASYSNRPDHPGKDDFVGKWSFDGNVVNVKLVTNTQRPKSHVWKLVPVRWGERQYLVIEDEIRDFAGMAMHWVDSNPDLRAQRKEMYRAPLMKMETFGFKRRFGTPKAPAKYAPWFDWEDRTSKVS